VSTPNFRFGAAATWDGRTSAGEGSTEPFHPALPPTLLPAAGYLLVTNGWNLNRAMTDAVGPGGTLTTDAGRLLQMRAPRRPLEPALSWPGTGRVFRPGAKWRYRWSDSRTGEHSGLSPLPNAHDVGAEASDGTGYVGQTAWFQVPVSEAPAWADTAQLFANTTHQDDVWYLDDEQPVVSGVDDVLLTGQSTDEELFGAVSVVTGGPSATPAGPGWQDGLMWPVARAWLHPSGRVFYYGLRRFGLQGPSVVKVVVTQGSDLVTLKASTTLQRVVEPGRLGQRLRLLLTAALDEPVRDPTVYRVVKVEAADQFRVWPELAVSPDLAAGATEEFFFALEDDRDARWTWVSEPNRPWLVDPLKVVAAGDDYDDGAQAWFTLGGRVFLQTRRRLYEALGSLSEEPSDSTVFLPFAEEGTPGFWTGCETPFGWVFLHEQRGVRVFDGQAVRPLGTEGDPFADFPPAAQFARAEPAALSDAVVLYDAGHRTVLVSYVPLGQGARKEVMAFDTTTRSWRGPWRERVACWGHARSTETADVLVCGDDSGNLLVREAQALDVLQPTAALPGAGDVDSWLNTRFLTDADGAFTSGGDQRLRGVPVWFTDGTWWYHARVAGVVDAQTLELDGPPVREDGATLASPQPPLSYGLGSVRWSLTTAYLDAGGDPARPVEFFSLNLRTRRGAASDAFEAAACDDGSGTFEGVQVSASSAPAAAAQAQGRVHHKLRLKRRAALVQVRLRGTARSGEPEVGRAVLVAEQRSGELPT
jgi:hypothetical protein